MFLSLGFQHRDDVSELNKTLVETFWLTLIEVAGCHNDRDSQGDQGLHSIIHGTVGAVGAQGQAGNCWQLEVLS